jgi:uncharacterized RDD family membrane protein YckC
MSDVKAAKLIIRTPEGIEFSLVLAGPFVRFLALIIDLVCILGATGLLSTVLSFFAMISPDLASALAVLFGFILFVGYGIVLEWFMRGQTLGKKFLRLRVMDEQGLNLHFGQVFLRNLLRTVDALPVLYLLGGTVSFFTVRNQRLGDKAAGTVVVRNAERFLPDIERLVDSKYNSLRDHPRPAALLRQRISGEEVSIALRAAIRREELDSDARFELFKELAEHFRDLVKFPCEAYEGVSNERFVLNVLEIVCAPQKSRSEAGGTLLPPRPAGHSG